MNLEENTEGKVLLTGDKEQKKGSFVGAESSKWAERALEGEQSREGEQSSPVVPTLTEELQSRGCAGCPTLVPPGQRAVSTRSQGLHLEP